MCNIKQEIIKTNKNKKALQTQNHLPLVRKRVVAGASQTKTEKIIINK